MKKAIKCLAVFFACGVIAITAQSKKPRTVSDYFMLLPAAQYEWLGKARNRNFIVAVRDDRNGYLELKREVYDGESVETAIALFRKSDGEAVIAIARTGCGMGDHCIGGLDLLQFRNGKWTDETRRLMPEITGEILLAAFDRVKTEKDEKFTPEELPEKYFKLPRKGTTVEVVIGGSTYSSTETLFYLKWNGAEFEISNTK